MKNYFLIFSSLLFLNPASIAQDSLETQEENLVPDTVQVGTFFTSLYDLNFAERSFKTDFWIWYNYRSDSLYPLESVEISNAKEFEFQSNDLEKINGVNWATHKCKAEVKQEWRLENFPFDQQELTIEIEDAISDSKSVIYLADIENSNYDKNIDLDGWNIKEFKVEQMLKLYETTYGNPELSGSSEYPGLKASFLLERDGTALFFKLFVGIFVAYLISLMIFFMGPENPERFGMIVGALFAGVANKYIVESLIPHTVVATLPDKIHNLTFVYIMLHLIVTVFVYRLGMNNKIKQGWRIDKIAFAISLVSYAVINIYWINQAIVNTR